MYKSWTCIAIALVGTLVFAAPQEADFHEGLAAYDRGDYEGAVGHWKLLAAAGDRESQFRLARMYFHGEAGQDDAEAFRLYTLSAEQGHPRAQNNLALMYQEGRGTESDPEQAALWYRRAADRGLAVAQGNLGRMYELGRGVPGDATQAALWYRRAAEQDHANSQYWLAQLYDTGRGVPADPSKAAKWYKRAAKQDHGPAQAAIGAMYATGRGVDRNTDKARKWLGRASGKGIVVELPEAEAKAPVVAETVKPAPTEPVAMSPEKKPAPVKDPGHIDLATAAELLDFPDLRSVADSARNGDVDAMYKLAGMYGSGNGAPQSLEDAARWYRAAAERGHRTAIYKTAFVYLNGRGVARKDYAEAYKWFVIAADQGIGDAEAWRDRIYKKMTDREKVQAEAAIAGWREEHP